MAYLAGSFWKYPLGALVVLLVLHRLDVGPGGRAGGYKSQTFEEMREHLAGGFDLPGDGFCSFIELESREAHCIELRIDGVGTSKTLLIQIPILAAREVELRAELETLEAQFEGVSIQEDSACLVVRLPGKAAYTGSVAYRAIEAGFDALGCGQTSTFTFWTEPGKVAFDPEWEIEFYGQAADVTNGLFKWYCERRVSRARDVLRERLGPPPSSNS